MERHSDTFYADFMKAQIGKTFTAKVSLDYPHGKMVSKTIREVEDGTDGVLSSVNFDVTFTDGYVSSYSCTCEGFYADIMNQGVTLDGWQERARAILKEEFPDADFDDREEFLGGFWQNLASDSENLANFREQYMWNYLYFDGNAGKSELYNDENTCREEARLYCTLYDVEEVSIYRVADLDTDFDDAICIGSEFKG